MQFVLKTKQEALNFAKKTDSIGVNYVQDPGPYVGAITKAEYYTAKSGAGMVEIVMETETGECVRASLVVKTKDGKTTWKNKTTNEEHSLPGINLICGSLMPCLGLKELNTITNGTASVYKNLLGQKIGMFVNIEKTTYKGKTMNNTAVLSFFNADTLKTGTEMLNGTPDAKKYYDIVKKLTVIDKTTSTNSFSSNDDNFFSQATTNDNDTQAKVNNEKSTNDSVESDAKDDDPWA